MNKELTKAGWRPQSDASAKDDIKLAASLEVDFLPFLKAMKRVAETMNV